MTAKWTLTVVLFLLFACLAVAANRIKGHDALEDDSEDAAAYERYMSATEASAPLMRHSHHGAAAGSSSSSSAAGSSGHHNGQHHGNFRNVFRSTGGHVTLIHSTDVASAAAAASASMGRAAPGFVPPPALPRRRLVHVWSPWSSWSTCSRTCGGGITSRHRTCRLEYARVSEGSGIRLSYHQCIGESSEYSMCNPQACSPLVANSHPEDFRQFQCSLYNNRTIRGHHVASWTPFNLGPNQCELSCRAGSRPNGIVYSFGKVLDGTRCTTDPEFPYKDFCVNGRCQTVGCDGRVGSRAKKDMCNVCGGTNSTCQKVAAVSFPSIDHLTTKSRTSQRATETYGYSPVVRIPRGATNVQISDNSTNYLALMDERQRYFINGNWIIDWPGRYESAGVAFHYERTRDAEVIRASGPLQQDLVVMVLLRENNPAVYYEYWLPRQTPTPPKVDLADSFASDARQVVQAAAATTSRPTTSRPMTTSTTTTAKPTTTTAATTASPDWEEFEPQPTAASLVRSPPRTYRGFFFPFFGAATTSQPPTTTTTTTEATTTPRVNNKTKRLNKKLRDAPHEHHQSTKINQVREHLGLVHSKKHSKASSVRSAVLPSRAPKSGCSVDGSCWKTVNGKKHFCLSEFVVRCKVLNYETLNGETRYEVEILQSYKNTIPILSREFIWAEPVPDCPCPTPYLRPGTDYIIMGKTDGKFRRNEIRLLLDKDSYVRVYNQANAERVLRIRRDEAKYCQKYKTEFNLTY